MPRWKPDQDLSSLGSPDSKNAGTLWDNNSQKAFFYPLSMFLVC